MNIQTYITSGILELYVLGSLSEQETKEVLHYATIYPEVRAEINAIERALRLYAMAQTAKPPVGVRA